MLSLHQLRCFVDGHDRTAMEHALTQAKRFGGPVIVHTVTRKGMGYAHAENHVADLMHATGIIDPVKVTRSALTNAASIASMVLTTDTLVVEKKEDEEAPAAGHGHTH